MKEMIWGMFSVTLKYTVGGRTWEEAEIWAPRVIPELGILAQSKQDRAAAILSHDCRDDPVIQWLFLHGFPTSSQQTRPLGGNKEPDS